MATSFIIHSSPTFEKDLTRLAKKYPQIRNDIQEALAKVQTDLDALIRRCGNDIQEALAKVQSSKIIGDAIPGGKGKLYKLRVSSSDLKRGKSGGFRVIFYLKAPSSLYPLICYFKGERGDVPIKDLEERAKELGLNII